MAVSLKIMPESADIDLEKIKIEISKKMKVQDARTEPVAFGLKALKVLVITKDVGTEAIESQIRAIPGVADVEVESATLI